MATQKWIPDPSWHICKVLHTLLVTSSDLCYLKSLYTAPLHEIDLALVIVTDKLHLTCFRSFASGTGIRQICFAGVSQSANVHKIRSFKGRLQQSCAHCINSLHLHTCKCFIYSCAEIFHPLDHPLKNQYFGKSEENKIYFPKINFWKWDSPL